MLNRQQKREAWRRAKRDPRALPCPVCGCKTLHIAVKADDIDHYNVYCEACLNRLFRTKEGLNGVTAEGYIDGRKTRIFKEERKNGKDFG